MAGYNLITDDSEALQAYLNNITYSTPLSLEEEKKCADTGDWEKLVNANLKFVVTVAKKFQNKGLPLSDLIAEGNVGLIHASKLYKSEYNVKFITYAVWHINEAIRRAIHYKADTVRVPVSQKLTYNKAAKVINKYWQTEDRPPSDEELEEATGKTMKQINGAINAKKICMSLDTPLGSSDDDGDSTLVDIVKNNNSPLADNDIEQSYKIKVINKVLNGLSNKEHDIIMLCYGFTGQEYTPELISPLFGCTPERIRQIRKEAIKKLRKRKILKNI
ncbi:sigma-70 family RNA polymerase sigma factor [Catenibacterium sp.]|uniref:sigma-70 family RNA polymerase sigma factor n=1 Tax=Catenibacterium sp. TaxID=2049022 RepID=UPI002E76828A|nr:RNA polymerase sigma factor RpoD/SigA [Catenibacterium sp.]MEE0042642.1 RNA polymerase sigma factor RpoD/SigA [Catenibacterium sp.]